MMYLVSKVRSIGSSFLALLVLAGCSADDSTLDLSEFMEKVNNKPRTAIAPLPPFQSYESFSYKAARLRDPFSQAVEFDESSKRSTQIDLSISPDLNRSKEYLERFNLAALRMVGSIEKNSNVWALINDSEGGIYTITDGNYLGRNHGKVTKTHDGYVDIVEIVPDGQGGWLERPQRLAVDE